MESTNREYSIVYSQEEMQSKVEELKMKGYTEGDIHVLVENDSILHKEDKQSGIHTHQANSVGSSFKSLFTGKDAIHTELAKLQLDKNIANTYEQDLHNGAILLYTDRKILEGTGETTSGARNTAVAPFGRDVERDEMRHDDAHIHDKDVTPDVPAARAKTNEIYTSDVSREDQHGDAGYGDKTRDSRLQGENIHPTGGTSPKDETAISEKTMDHEPALQSAEGQDNLNREEGINRRQDEQSPGVDPNLGPAPFGRDSEEEHLINNQQEDDLGEAHDSREEQRLEKERNKNDHTPPTQRLF
ncbi:general stress protein [Planococcus sp. YIM B11945]|uniref:general stress protein n=1 Tax=Planococcus sp. YIM B11945 TaxID=3435410 RepID=UPI003D7C4859